MSATEQNRSQHVSTIVMLAAIVVILTGIKAASVIVVPFLLALFFSVIVSTLFTKLVELNIPAGIALLVTLLSVVFFFTLLGVIAGNSLQNFSSNLNVYEAQLQANFAHLSSALDGYGIHLPEGSLTNWFDPNEAMRYAATMLKTVGSSVTNGFLILLLMAFLLLESLQINEKFQAMHINNSNGAAILEVVKKIKKYMALKSLTSIATGVVVYIMLLIFGLDFAVLWGITAFILNFIPNIGSILAAIPAVLLAVVQFGFTEAILIAMGYVFINTLIGSIIEPRVMGKGLGLSTLVVFMSLIFWGWLLGPIGMLLSVPLTITLKIALAQHEQGKNIAILMGDGVKKEQRSKQF